MPTGHCGKLAHNFLIKKKRERYKMPINKKAIDEKRGIRFYWDCQEGDENAEWIEVRLLSNFEIEEIDKLTKKFFKKHVQPIKSNGKPDKRAAIQVIEDWEWASATSEQEHARLRNAKCLSDWCVFEEDDDGNLKPFPRTDENVNYLLEKDPIFSQFAFRCIASLAETEDVQRARLEKNLPDSRKKSAKKSSAKNA